MPKSSDVCKRECEILLLLELLRRRRRDLNFERGESLLGLVAGSVLPRRLVNRSPSRIGVLAGIKFGKNSGVRFTDPVQLIVTGLELAPDILPPESPLQEIREQALATISEDLFGGPVARPYPSPTFAEPGAEEVGKRRIDLLIKPLKRLIQVDERTQDLICAVVLPFAFKMALAPHPVVKAAGILASLGCGIEIAATPVGSIALPEMKQLRESAPGG